MTIYEIKRRTQESAPFFFSRKTMQFFGQTMRSFSVRKQPDGRYKIEAKAKGIYPGHEPKTVRYFNPETDTLDLA